MKKALLPAVAVSAAWQSILAGTSVVGIVVFLPARRTIGATAYARFARATDLGRGRVLYPLLGIGGFVLSWATFLLALLTGAPRRLTVPLGLAAASAAGVMAT